MIAARELGASGQTLAAGTQLEEFVIERVLGEGGFGITYLARDTGLGRLVVIKENLPVQFAWRDPQSLTVAPRHTSGDASDFAWSLENFSKEAAMLASLDHPGIVKVLRSFSALGTAYFVMPFVEGVAFDELIDARMAEGQPFSEEELRGLLDRTLDALAHLHDRGIYHRDIKPANILISNDGIPALIDFGSARQRLSERSMTVVESAGYTPFEQLQSRGKVGPWSDLYALGATLVKAITFESPPKAADRIGAESMAPLASRDVLAERYSVSFLNSIDRSLAVNTADRWQNAKEWQDGMDASVKSARNLPPPSEPIAPSVLPFQQAPLQSDNEWEQLNATIHDNINEGRSSGRKPLNAILSIVVTLVFVGVLGVQVSRCARTRSESRSATEVFVAENPPETDTSAPETESPISPFAAASVEPAAWLAMAQNEDPLAQALLGDALFWGGQKSSGIEVNQAEAVKWIQKSAAANHPLGLSLLGLLRMDGCDWIPKDEDAANRDYSESVRLGLLRDAENGGPVWWTCAGQAFELGKGIKPDPRAAVVYYQKAAATGYPDAINSLASCYMEGNGVPKDAAEAVRWFRKAAGQGYAAAQCYLGYCYQKGIGISKNAEVAVYWYRKAADQGYTKAQYNLGFCYANGNGILKDAAEAVNWFRKAADQGDADAQNRIGYCYQNGIGIAKDAADAVKWYRKAGVQGNANGMFNLGLLYLNGDQGLVQDTRTAYKLFLLAAAAGSDQAKESCQSAARLLTPEQIEEIQEACRNWKPTLETSSR